MPVRAGQEKLTVAQRPHGICRSGDCAKIGKSNAEPFYLVGDRFLRFGSDRFGHEKALEGMGFALELNAFLKSSA